MCAFHGVLLVGTFTLTPSVTDTTHQGAAMFPFGSSCGTRQPCPAPLQPPGSPRVPIPLMPCVPSTEPQEPLETISASSEGHGKRGRADRAHILSRFSRRINKLGEIKVFTKELELQIELGSLDFQSRAISTAP